jgi:hypothetical protein
MNAADGRQRRPTQPQVETSIPDDPSKRKGSESYLKCWCLNFESTPRILPARGRVTAQWTVAGPSRGVARVKRWGGTYNYLVEYPKKLNLAVNPFGEE